MVDENTPGGTPTRSAKIRSRPMDADMDDKLRYSITGGADMDAFDIDMNTGQVSRSACRHGLWTTRAARRPT